VYQDNPK